MISQNFCLFFIKLCRRVEHCKFYLLVLNVSSMTKSAAPKDILILGAGVFGLSTALALLNRQEYSTSHITILDSAKILPNPHGSSVDSSRIIRADYPYKAYAKLAAQAQDLWRDKSASGWGGEERYHETGFVLTADPGLAHYVQKAMDEVMELAKAGLPLDPSKIESLDDEAAVKRATGYDGLIGQKGYANWNSGWADAGKCVAYAIKRLQSTGGDRVTIRANSQVSRLLFGTSTNRCTGVQLSDQSIVDADLTILATGAWTPSLIDLQGRCIATGQTLAYLKITDAEAEILSKTPVIINMSTGIFIIPPNGNELKIARHGYGYRNPQPVTRSTDSACTTVCVPNTKLPIAPEAHHTFRSALATLFPNNPDLASRPFTHTRLCYYTDTPSGNFLIAHHPSHPNLVVATGGSGHGFKFFPVLGEKIVDCIQGKLDLELAHLWRWKPDAEITEEERGFITCDDGSRSGPKGMILEEEMSRSEEEVKAMMNF